MLVAFLVRVEAAGTGVTERKLVAAVLEIVLRQQEQPQGIEQAGFAQVTRPENQGVVIHGNLDIAEARRVHQHQAANAEPECVIA